MNKSMNFVPLHRLEFRAPPDKGMNCNVFHAKISNKCIGKI
jgi:hypothetical protein